MLFSFPGTPVLYYGDEIGMGDNIYLHDRNSVRTPMQWSAETAMLGFLRLIPNAYFYQSTLIRNIITESNNVIAQQNNPNLYGGG